MRATTANHVFYRSADRHLQLLYWVGIGAVTHADLSAGVVAPLALGDPSTSFDTTRGTNIVMYRGTDGHVHS